MTTFWRGLEKVRGWVAVPAVWRTHMGDEDFERVRNTLLLPNGRQGIWFPSPDVCECKMDVVKHAEDHIVGVSECGGCDDVALTAADIAMMELSWKKFGRAIANALKCEPKDVDIGLPGARQIAAFGGASMPVILVIQYDRHEFADLLRRIILQVGKNFVLLSPTGRFMDANGKGLLSRVNAGFFALETFVSVDVNGTLRSAKNAGEVFSAFLPEAAEPASDNEAIRLFALVEKLELETKFRKAPITRVFQLYCLRGESRNSVAKKCACAPSLITLRLKVLEKKLGRPPEQLRQLSGHFEKIADSLTDSRARDVYRPGTMDDGDDENSG